MAKVSQITVPDGTTYDVGVKYPNVSPILSKTFTGVIASAANWANGVFFFGSIKPVSWTGLWSIKYKVYAEAAGQPLSQARATVTIAGNQGAEQTVDEYFPKCEMPVVGIAAHGVSSAILSTDYYSLEGQRLDAPQKGVMIRVEHLSNGQHITTKVIK